MKINHIVTSLLLLILVFVLSGCAGMSTKSRSTISCSSVDINALLNSGDYQRKVDNFIIIQDATLTMDIEVEKTTPASTSRLIVSKGLVRCLNNSLPDNFGVKSGMRIL